MLYLSKKTKWFLYKILSLLSVVRGYNLLVIVVAQYVTSIFILSENQSIQEVLLDFKLLCIVAATVITIASGYIINNFYDSEKDLINRPQKSILDRLVSQRTKLIIYFVLNFSSVVVASYVSFRAVLFFSSYIFGIWLYSHKLKKYPFTGNIVAMVLAIFPFFAIFIYYANYDYVIFAHATFLMLIILMREMIKDLENLKGDFAANYHTIPVVYGEKFSKKMLFGLVLASILTGQFLIKNFSVGKMYYFFWLSSFCLVVFSVILWRSSNKKDYLLLHNILKFIIVLGVLSICLIDPRLFF